MTYERLVQSLLASPLGRLALYAAGIDPVSSVFFDGSLSRSRMVVSEEKMLAPGTLAESIYGLVSNWRWSSQLQSVGKELIAHREELERVAQRLLSAPATSWWREPIRRHAQVWITAGDEPPQKRLLVTDLEEFNDWVCKPRSAFWTATALPELAVETMIDAWELPASPRFATWRLVVTKGARVYEIMEPADYVWLCTRYPKDTSDYHGQWWCEWGVTQREIVTPGWKQVAKEWDAVHLGMRGLLTAHSVPQRIDHRRGTLLEGWSTESTVWFRWVFAAVSKVDVVDRRLQHEGL
jgi:hypothetical protein